MELPLLLRNFDIDGLLVTVVPLGNGNVNDTFLAIYRNTFDEHQVVLQKINRNVFSSPEKIMQNLHKLTAHAHKKLERWSHESDRVWQMPKIVKTKDGKDFMLDENGDLWRVLTMITSATAFDQAQNTEHALECGSVLGHFHWLVSDMNPLDMVNPLPGFHITPNYLQKFDETVATERAIALMDSSMEVRRVARFIEERRGIASVLQNALDSGELTLRMMHGDPKVNNIMIDNFTGKGTAMIDLDTVSPGLVHYDFGDALRSICNPAGEEEQNLSKVVFDIDLCAAFCKGYMAQGKNFLTDADRKYMYDAIRLITFELGLRFFEDYLAGSKYFKTKFSEQNLNRARVQLRLVESIESRERMIRDVLLKA